MTLAPGATPSHALRQDIQGLRGIAVLLVVLFHAGVPGLSGGFIGVDVFFVISGYLISGLLLRDVERHGRLDLAGFYARRAKRLLPAALVLLMAVMAVSLWLYPPAEQRVWLSAARAASLYLSNVWLAGRALDYFASETHGNPLLHTWSLAVEEQFYLVWPFVLWLFLQRAPAGAAGRRRMLAKGVASLSLVSLGICVWLTGVAQPWAFYGMPLRAWEFGLGALVAFVGQGPAAHRGAALAAWVGLATVAVSATTLHEAQAFPGWWALLPASGTALLLLGIDRVPDGVVARLLAVAPLARLGDLSYSWYLWHWPLLVWLDVQLPRHGPVYTVVAVLASLVLAQLSLSLVENPVRRARLTGWHSRGIVAVALTASVATSVLAWSLMQLPVPPAQAAALSRYEQAVEDKPVLYARRCHQFFFDTEPKPCSFGAADAARTMVLLGDSHAAQWFPALEALALRHGWRLVTMTKAACPALDLRTRNPALKRDYVECNAWREASLRRIAELRPEIVVLTSANYYEVAPELRAQALSRLLDQLRVAGAMQLVLRDTPRPGFDVPTCLARAIWRGRDADQACHYDRRSPAAWREDIAHAERAQVGTVPSARYLDLSAAVCDREPCPVQRGGRVMFGDAHHLTASFARDLSVALEQAFADALGPGQSLLPAGAAR